jgi:hypothetical protein
MFSFKAKDDQVEAILAQLLTEPQQAWGVSLREPGQMADLPLEGFLELAVHSHGSTSNRAKKNFCPGWTEVISPAPHWAGRLWQTSSPFSK